MISIRYNKEKDIVFWEVSESVTKQELLDALKKLSEYSTSINNFRVIQIDRGAKPLFKPVENINLAFAAKKYFHLFNSVRCAFVTNKSKNMAFFILAITSIMNKRFIAKVFSSEKKAEEWILLK